MDDNQSSYRQIIKATSIFGGVQVFSIVISIIRSKFIAVLLGPAGMGIAGLLGETTALISQLTNFGLAKSAIKDIAAANESKDINSINKTTAIFRRLVWITGLLGAFSTLFLSSWLSQLTFGNSEYTIAFIWISITLLFNQLASGQFVLLQGMRKLKDLAKANMYGSVLGLFTSIPLYYLYGVNGIVPAIILSSLTGLILAWYFGKKVKIEKVKINNLTAISDGKGMIQMGIMLGLSGLITSASSYIVRIFISNYGSLDDVGLYNAGFGIISTYVGLVFAAMVTDYYPRLSGVAHDNNKSILLINQQAEISLLILAPILTIFLIFINFIVILLYSSKFTPINEMIHWAALGMYFKAVSWAVAYILLAKGKTKLFFWTELTSNVYILLLNLLGYYFYGLNGLGIAFFVSYIIYFFQIYLLINYKYKFSFSKNFYKIASIQILLGIICFLIIKLVVQPFAYFLGLPFIFLSCYFSYVELDKRLNIKNIIKNILKK